MTKEQDKIQAGNLKEEIAELLEPCIKCGMCKSRCGVFKVLREEGVSARGKSIILSDKTLNKIIFQCNLCKSCEEICPLNLKLCDAFKKAREAMVLSGKELKQNKEMIENIRKTGNPFGDLKDKNPDKLYCC